MDKIYYGVILIFYKQVEGSKKFLIIENTETGNVSFVSGASEENESLEETAFREANEEIGLEENSYELIKTEVKQEFIFGPNKKERAGHKGEYTAFLIDATNIPKENFKASKDAKNLKWVNSEEVLNMLSFEDVKEVFRKITKK